MTQKTVLITGAGGYLGQHLLSHYLECTDYRVIAWVHANNRVKAQAQHDHLISRYPRFADRFRVAWGDLRDDLPFCDVDPRDVTMILHGAAIIRFNVDLADAEAVNLGGTTKICEFAQRCGKLESFGLLSSVYSSGLLSGVVDETLFSNDDGFCNHYEWSKWASEAVLSQRYGHLPYKILRLATILADNESGSVTQFNAVHNTLMLFYYGLLSLIPGKKEVPLYFINRNFAIAAIVAAMQASDQRIFNLCHRQTESVTLEGLIECVFATFAEDPAFSARRLMKPLYADQATFELLVQGMKGFGGDVINTSLASVTPFARQLFIPKDIHNANLRAAMTGDLSVDPLRQIQATCRYLVATRWGQKAQAHLSH